MGGWDPYNVTEDADLGLRLARFGYRAGTISLPTYEDAPETVGVWLPQRTRWFKGWTQTWLVHMRRPLAALRELGPASFAVTQVLVTGMLISSLAHSLLLATALVMAARIVLFQAVPAVHPLLFGIDLTIVLGGYASFLLLGWWTLSEKERKGFWKLVPATPVYWVLLSCAAWRALWELYRRPFHWNKTPHVPRRRPLGPGTGRRPRCPHCGAPVPGE